MVGKCCSLSGKEEVDVRFRREQRHRKGGRGPQPLIESRFSSWSLRKLERYSAVRTPFFFPLGPLTLRPQTSDPPEDQKPPRYPLVNVAMERVPSLWSHFNGSLLEEVELAARTYEVHTYVAIQGQSMGVSARPATSSTCTCTCTYILAGGDWTFNKSVSWTFIRLPTDEVAPSILERSDKGPLS